jgi:transcriptional regulator with XRE-family HTH domain
MAKLKIIKELCAERGISIADLAEEIGIGVAATHKIIRENSTRIETLEKIAAALQVKMDVFFDKPVDEPTEAIQEKSIAIIKEANLDFFIDMMNWSETWAAGRGKTMRMRNTKEGMYEFLMLEQ